MDRRLAWGYRAGEVKLPILGDLKEGTEIGDHCWEDDACRPPVMASLGCSVSGVACPHPDPHDPITMMGGVIKRFAAKPPRANKRILGVRATDKSTFDYINHKRFGAGGVSRKSLRVFVREFCKANFVQICPEADTSVESWLAKTNYPEWRKEELREKWKEVESMESMKTTKKWWKVGSFQKDETYPDYKWPRGINARKDQFKCVVGPIFHLMEEIVYQNPAFIKHVPVSERAAYISERLSGEGGVYVATDYTSFEALFTEDIMDCVEFELYDYMTAHLPEHNLFMWLVREVLGGTNRCEFRSFVVELFATRMSGEMCTSLGNGFSNLMFMNYVCYLNGVDCIGVVEGDDGLFYVVGAPPTSEDFELLGLVIKLEVHTTLSTASFCGLIFDSEELINITDPAKVIATFGWAAGKYARCRDRKKLALLRCKALSLAHQYPGVPVVAALADYGLRVTDGVRITDALKSLISDSQTRWQASNLLHLPDQIPRKDVGPRTRILMEEKFGLSVEMQIAIETYLNNLTVLKELDSGLFDLWFPASWRHYFVNYVYSVPLSSNLRQPGDLWSYSEKDRATVRSYINHPGISARTR